VVQEIHVQELAKKLAAGELPYLIDVRRPWEHDIAALANSVLIPLDQLSARAEEIRPPAGALVVVYCHHGVRSRAGAALLEQLNIQPVRSLAGGIDAWSCLIDPAMPRY
jgi:rhodanese-related sulfurtransferase